MIHEPELIAIELRAHILRLTMTEVCREAGVHRNGWFRARKRGRADYRTVTPIERTLDRLEAERCKR
jgi:DNA-binding phage protein